MAWAGAAGGSGVCGVSCSWSDDGSVAVVPCSSVVPEMEQPLPITLSVHHSLSKLLATKSVSYKLLLA